jgi:hypothetical protein
MRARTFVVKHGKCTLAEGSGKGVPSQRDIFIELVINRESIFTVASNCASMQ